MIYWAYEIHDRDTDNLLAFETGFESESEAEFQATMDAKVENIKNFYIRTLQPPEECDDIVGV
jgi:hypothetical protein